MVKFLAKSQRMICGMIIPIAVVATGLTKSLTGIMGGMDRLKLIKEHYVL